MKIDQAQFRELESFSKFGGEMDAVTAFTIDKGQKNTQLLIQPQYSPMPVEEQISILYCGTQGLLKRFHWTRCMSSRQVFARVTYLSPTGRTGCLKDRRYQYEIRGILEKTAKELWFIERNKSPDRLYTEHAEDTAAMKMVSSAKFHHAQTQTEHTLTYANKLSAILNGLLSAEST